MNITKHYTYSNTDLTFVVNDGVPADVADSLRGCDFDTYKGYSHYEWTDGVRTEYTATLVDDTTVVISLAH